MLKVQCDTCLFEAYVNTNVPVPVEGLPVIRHYPTSNGTRPPGPRAEQDWNGVGYVSSSPDGPTFVLHSPNVKQPLTRTEITECVPCLQERWLLDQYDHLMSDTVGTLQAELQKAYRTEWMSARVEGRDPVEPDIRETLDLVLSWGSHDRKRKTTRQVKEESK